MNSGYFSKSQADRLGDRLRSIEITAAEIVEINEYRQSFGPAYSHVMRQLEEFGSIEQSLTGRPSKSTNSIIAKLHRESVRLSQMQDIAGCRMIVSDCQRQTEIAGRISLLFPKSHVIDRRLHPSHGYRAIHIVVENEGLVVEIQIRTELQHLWAEFSEKLADQLGSEVKYGGGPFEVRNMLAQLSELVEAFEKNQEAILELDKKMVLLKEREPKMGVLLKKRKLARFKKDLAAGFELAKDAKNTSAALRARIIEVFDEAIVVADLSGDDP